MSLERFIKIIMSKFLLIFCVGVLTASIVFFLTQNEEKQFTSKTIINTGVVSGYNIENHNSDSRIDRDYTRNELENLINLATAYETLEMLAMRLIAHYLEFEEADGDLISTDGFEELQSVFSGSLAYDNLRKENIKSTISYLNYLTDTINDASLIGLVYSDHKFFGLEQLQKIKVSRKGASDLIEFSYTTSDPYVCKKTLELLSEVFIEKHRLLKEGQSEDVLGYFEKATKESRNKLRLAEDKLLRFRVDNQIINYYEQTRFIADKKEGLDEMVLKEQMQLEGAISSKERIDSQLKNRGLLAELNNSLLSKRNELSELTKKLTLYELSGPNDKFDNASEAGWIEQRDQLESEITNITLQTHNVKYTPEGLLTNELLSSWLKSVIQVETSKSRLNALNSRKEEFQSIYAQFAPWGSRLKKIEREIALAEEAYLENLHSFNQARLHLQNTIMSSNLRVLDAPFLPLKDNGSKRFLLILVGFAVGIIMTLGIVILMEFLDNTMKTPSEVAENLNLEVAGVLPKLPNPNAGFNNPSDINYLSIRNRAIELLYQRLLINKKSNKPGPYIMFTSSMRGKEGVSFTSRLIKKRFKKDMQKVLYVKPLQSFSEEIDESIVDTIYYKEYESFGEVENIVNWLDRIGPNDWINKYQNVIIEVPAIIGTSFPLHLLKGAHEFLLVCRSNRVWSKADSNCLELLKESLIKPPIIMLNGVRMESMEEFLGELPKSRSWLRRWMKNIVNFNFSINDKI
jgi:uncharacterized protein involved in exopolysaccharide biosynthesis